MAVQPNSGMTIQIATGRGWFGKHWVNNDSEYTMTLAQSDVVLNRYVAVCIRVDESDAVRDVVPYLKYSEFATNPVKPAMERTETVKEYCLAYVYIKAGATAITAADITDTRADESLCGWVTGLIEQLSTATLFEQFTAIFNDWFNNLTDLINENTETMLVSALPTSTTVTLTSGGWTLNGGVYKQSVNVANMTTSKSVIVQPNANSVEDYTGSGVVCSGQSANVLEFTAQTQPTVNLSVDVLYMGV
jgi:hypothetical protein